MSKNALTSALSTLVGFLALFSPLASAQIGGGSIVGEVIDAQSAAVPGAAVKAINAGTNIANSSVTNDRGYYEFPLLPAGQYIIEVSATGFETKRTNQFALNSGTRPRFDITLGVGSVTESVTVEAAAPLLNATTTELGVVIENRKMEALPLNGRNFQDLVRLQPGVVNKPPSSTGGRGGIEFNGSSAFGNNIMLDGIDTSFGEHNGSQNIGLGGGTIINAVSIEALEEFKTSSSAFSAEFGRSTGGVVNLTTKSGTNDFHGTLFEFLRNDKFDANAFDNNRRLVSKLPLRYNQFGGNIGGPIKKDKLFFFFNYEGLRVSQGTSSQGNVPTQLLLDSVTPAIRKHLEGMALSCSNPIPNQPYLCFHFQPDTRSNDESSYLSRADWQVTSAHRLTIRHNHLGEEFKQPGSGVRPSNRQIYPTKTHNALVQDSWTISPRMFNEVRIGLSRFNLDRKNSTIDTEPSWIELTSPSMSTDTQSRLQTTTDTYELADNFSWIHGNHTIKVGMDLRKMIFARVQATNPTHYYNTVPDLIADRPVNVRVSPGNPGRGYRSTQSGFFVQDDWRVSRRLQINAGMRYEYYAPLSGGGFNLASRDFFGPYKPANAPMWAPDKNNFGPRLGVVFDPGGNQKWVVRAGGAITYVPQQPFFYYDFSFIDPRIPFSAFLTASDIPAGAGVSLAFPFPQSYLNRIAGDPSLLPKGLILGRSSVDPLRRDEYAGHWNLSIQHAITKALAIQMSYTGSRGVHELVSTIQNLYRPGTTQRVDPSLGQITYIEASGRHLYNSFQFSTNYRATRRGSVDFYYTYSKNMVYGTADVSDGPRNGELQDFSNFKGSYGPKTDDLRHHLVTVFTHEVPAPASLQHSRAGKVIFGGWNVQGIVDWRSGFAMNIFSNINTPQNGQAVPWGFRPDVVSGQSLYAKDRPVPTGAGFQFYTQSWLNPDAVDITAPYAQRRFGNAGYNIGTGPHNLSFDASVVKTFQINERHRVEFRTEFFNPLNHPNFNNPDMNVFSGRFDPAGVPIKNPTFGLITGKSGNRNIQFGLKYRF